MQAGKQRAVLPLIRKFNEHSGRLLDSVLYVTSGSTTHVFIDLHGPSGDGPNKRRRIEGGIEEVWDRRSSAYNLLNSFQRYSQLDLEDLHDNQSSAGIALNMLDSQRYSEGRSGDASEAAAPVRLPLRRIHASLILRC